MEFNEISLKTKINKMLIKSVKLNNSGFKGITVEYATSDKNNGRSFINEHKSKRKAPIHKELEEGFKKLKDYFLDICDYSLAYREKDLLDTTITGVTLNEKGFIISGTKSVLDGHKTLDLTTPIISSVDGYNKYYDVHNIITAIFDETKAYMIGEKYFSDEQLVLNFYKGKDDFDSESFLSLPKIEQRDLATKVLEEMGCMVIHSEEIEPIEIIETKK